MRYKIEVLHKGKWRFAGMFSDRYIPQLVNACINQAKRGKKMYEKMRVVEVKRSVKHGDSTVLR